MNIQSFQPRNYRINDVELNWAKLTKPVSPFGVMQYELQIATTDKTVADEWSANHLNVKSELDKETKQPTGKFIASLKRKAFKADQSDNGAPTVVGADAQPIDASKLGNGSRGNVIIYQMYYKNAGREGISSSLTAVQVAEFKEYTGDSSFEPIADLANPAAFAPAEAPATDEATANPF